MIKQAEEHISLVQTERSYYRSVLKECSDNLKKTFTTGEVLQVPPPNARIPAMSNRTTFHYSFDMAQQVMFCKFNSHVTCYNIFQVHYPSDPFQPGPIYFLTPRKCAIFGVCCEAVPRQVSSSLKSVLLMHLIYMLNIK